jgi:hypothetical protein
MMLLALKTALKFVALLNLLVIIYTCRKKWKEHVCANTCQTTECELFCVLLLYGTVSIIRTSTQKHTIIRIQESNSFHKYMILQLDQKPENLQCSMSTFRQIAYILFRILCEHQCRGSMWKSYSFITVYYYYYYYYYLWLCSPARVMAFSFTRFLDHTQRRATVGRTLWMSDQLVAETSTW